LTVLLTYSFNLKTSSKEFLMTKTTKKAKSSYILSCSTCNGSGKKDGLDCPNVWCNQGQIRIPNAAKIISNKQKSVETPSSHSYA
jgi:DnaJ-class molecular chaperone